MTVSYINQSWVNFLRYIYVEKQKKLSISYVSSMIKDIRFVKKPA